VTQRIAITGGTGFLGRFITRALAARGHALRLLARSRPAHPQLADLSFEAVAGDLDNEAALELLLEGADLVVHAAGAIAGPHDAFAHVNVAGTAKLAAAARARGAKLILISSMAARMPALSAYARSKAEGEAAAEAVLGPPRSWVILRPTAIYGPWDMATLDIFRLIGRRIAWLPGRPGGRVTVIHAADMAAAVAAFAEPDAPGGVFELTDAEIAGYDWAEVARRVAEIRRVSPRPVFLPPAILRLAARTGLGGPMLTPGKAEELLHPDWASSTRAQPPPALWRPIIPFEQGLTETLGWYWNHGFLPYIL